MQKLKQKVEQKGFKTMQPEKYYVSSCKRHNLSKRSRKIKEQQRTNNYVKAR